MLQATSVKPCRIQVCYIVNTRTLATTRRPQSARMEGSQLTPSSVHEGVQNSGRKAEAALSLLPPYSSIDAQFCLILDLKPTIHAAQGYRGCIVHKAPRFPCSSSWTRVTVCFLQIFIKSLNIHLLSSTSHAYILIYKKTSTQQTFDILVKTWGTHRKTLLC